MAVFVLDNDGKPLMPCSEKRARILLESGKARLHRFRPFSICMTDKGHGRDLRQDLTLKISPGSKSTGFAIVSQDGETTRVVFLAELVHRGFSIVEALQSRSKRRKRRRSAIRYRANRFSNRRKGSGWLPPSIVHRVETVETWVRRFLELAPINSIIAEVAPFEPQGLPVALAIEQSQQEDRRASEKRHRVYIRWGRKCIYCGDENSSLELDHIVARSKGGSNRDSNLVPACSPCNEKKGALSIQQFLIDRPELLQKILRGVKAPMRDSASSYAMRRGIREALSKGPLPIETSTIGSRRANLKRLKLPSSPALCAACAGDTGMLTGWDLPILIIQSKGRGSYQRTGSYIPGRTKGDHRNRLIFTRQKIHNGFQSGDIVKGVVKRGKNPGLHRGRVTVRAKGAMDLVSDKGKRIQVAPSNCRLIQRADGYSYSIIKSPRKGAVPPPVEVLQANARISGPRRKGPNNHGR